MEGFFPSGVFSPFSSFLSFWPSTHTPPSPFPPPHHPHLYQPERFIDFTRFFSLILILFSILVVLISPPPGFFSLFQTRSPHFLFEKPNNVEPHPHRWTSLLTFSNFVLPPPFPKPGVRLRTHVVFAHIVLNFPFPTPCLPSFPFPTMHGRNAACAAATSGQSGSWPCSNHFS